MDTPTPSLSFRPHSITQFLGGTALLLLLLHLAAMAVEYGDGPALLKKAAKLFDFGLEKNVPTYFSSLLLFWAFALSTLTAVMEPRTSRWPWFLLGGGFLCMSMDEFIGFHEKVSECLVGLFRIKEGILYFAWVFPAVPLVLVIGLIFLRFFLKLPRATRLLVGLSAVIYLGGALGLELAGADLYSPNAVRQSLSYTCASTIEESLEMAGLLVFIHALLLYLGNRFGTVELRILK